MADIPQADRAPTPSQTVGPFFGFALPFPGDADADRGPDAVRIEGQVFDADGAPVVDALLEVWHGEAFARCGTDASGRYRVAVPKPRATSTGSTDAPHLEVTVFARGLLRQLATRIYFSDEAAANAADPVIAKVDPARRPTLIARREGDAFRFDIHLHGEGETVFFGL
jgi:protocatechuate 3,4-dioxygenase alpha subunit